MAPTPQGGIRSRELAAATLREWGLDAIADDTVLLIESGRGLDLLHTLASTHGWSLTPTGKVVWFTHTTPAPPAGQANTTTLDLTRPRAYNHFSTAKPNWLL